MKFKRSFLCALLMCNSVYAMDQSSQDICTTGNDGNFVPQTVTQNPDSFAHVTAQLIKPVRKRKREIATATSEPNYFDLLVQKNLALEKEKNELVVRNTTLFSETQLLRSESYSTYLALLTANETVKSQDEEHTKNRDYYKKQKATYAKKVAELKAHNSKLQKDIKETSSSLSTLFTDQEQTKQTIWQLKTTIQHKDNEILNQKLYTAELEKHKEVELNNEKQKIAELQERLAKYEAVSTFLI